MKCVVVGTGYTGLRLLNALPADSAGINRSAVTADAPRQVLQADLDTARELPLSLGGAALVYTVPPPGSGDDDPRLQRFLDLLGAAPPARTVYLSTSGVYGNHGGAVVDETTPTAPQSARARRRVAAERALDTWCNARDVALVVLRVPGIYGPGRLGLHRIEARTPVIAGSDAHPGNRIHVDDLVTCCVAAIGAPAGVYNVGDGDHRSATWFAGEVARQAGLDPPPEVSRAEAEATFGSGRLSFLAESRRVDTRRMRDVLAVTPRYADPADGIAAALAAMRDENSG